MATKIDHDDLVTCPICYEQFTNPKCLPCNHTFCQSCLKSYIITQLGGEGKQAKEFPCPVCRQEVTVTDPKLTSESIADTMPGNHVITSLIERSVQVSASCEDEKWCGPCYSDNEKTLSVSWCTQCSETLCENCVKYHRRFRKSKHEIISVEEMKKEKTKPAQPLDVEEPCMKHTGEVLKVYCVGHKEMCCVICLATSHRKCEQITTFEEMVSTGSKNAENMQNFAKHLDNLEEKTDKLRNKTDENLTTLNNRHDEISKKVTTTVQQAIDKLDHLRSSFLTTFKQMHKGESIKLTEAKERIEVFQQNVKKGKKLLKTVQEQGSPKQVFITTEKLKMQLKQDIDSLQTELNNASFIDYNLRTDYVIETIRNNLTSVVEVDINQTLGLCSSLKEISSIANCFFIEDIEPIDVMKLEVHKEHSVKPNGEITGGTYLPDGRLVLCCLTNLQVYDKDGNFLFDTSYKAGCPRDTCLISSSEILVSFGGGINKYEIQQNELNEKQKISSKSDAWGLAATKDNIIVGYTPEVDVLSMDGQVVQNFSRSGDHVSCVAVSLTGNVYYTDRNDVVCKTLDGREVRRFTNPKVRNLTGIAIDKYGNVYVSGFDSNNICVFSADGSHSKMMITDINSPQNIGFNSTETCLYVCTFGDGCHFYSLKKKD
ncbi:hypothetical protein KUTeg_006033 [Tegillarca granosa]|uniref:TRIM56 n=1 Tax=Tegillarca granosa TaxID=220873 RepID=A0ABQ9FFE9_TEGGR|nr:hypothetical protein KUTeg_006033 [Tegillarca granosa]